MKGSFRKLIAAGVTLVMAAAMVVTVSYAWVALSSAPEVSGIEVSIGGGNTILIAANKQETIDGVTYNYPSDFKSTLNFLESEEYEYLLDLSGLSPVSTADGIHWFLPQYYNLSDREVVNGGAIVGHVKPITSFYMDAALEYANLSSSNKAKAVSGSYVYLDFWVVSPNKDVELRVSVGDSDMGSFAIELKDVQGGENGYTLVEGYGAAAASMRVGFLVNEDRLIDGTLDAYRQSNAYDEEYTELRGSYPNKGDETWYSREYRFSIYEPNGDIHPSLTDGPYVVTSPVGYDGYGAYLADVSGNLAVQLKNSWKEEADGVPLEELFAASIAGKWISSAEEAKNLFYINYLQGQVSSYVDRGDFIKSTAALYEKSVDGTVATEELVELAVAGATDDSLIAYLEKNVPQRIRMFVWLEGQDIDCTDILCTLDLAMSIELAGGDQRVYSETE